jgi:hypothetical protein
VLVSTTVETATESSATDASNHSKVGRLLTKFFSNIVTDHQDVQKRADQQIHQRQIL